MSENPEDKKPLSEEDFLKKYLEETDMSKSKAPQFEEAKGFKQEDTGRVADLQYFAFDAKDLPLGIFYPNGTKIMVRAAQVKEIQSYSMVDDKNFYDMIEKMNDMLSACVRVKYVDDKVGSYLDVKDGDRVYLIFLIRELTFQQGNVLAANATCKCGLEMQVELKRQHFCYHDMPESLGKYFETFDKVFKFETISGQIYSIAPPTIGLQKSFTEYIVKEYNEKKTPNLSFLKIIPFTLTNRNSITVDGIKAKLVEFQSLSIQDFQFLNAAVNKMQFGIKELKKICTQCGEEVHTDMVFPNGPSAIFALPDAFDQFIKK